MKNKGIILTMIFGVLGFACTKNTNTSMTSTDQGTTNATHPCVAAGYYASLAQCQFNGLNCSITTIQSGGSALVCFQGTAPTPVPTIIPPVGPATPDNSFSE
jgi:hypothetical protein